MIYSKLIINMVCLCGIVWSQVWADLQLETLSVDNLRQYTKVVKCLAKMNAEFSECNRKANETGRQFLDEYKI